MNARATVAITWCAALALSGCGPVQQYINKPWGRGTYIPAAVCAVVGGFAGAAIESQGFSGQSIRSGESCNVNTGQCLHDSPDYAAATAIGAGGGAVLCGLLGHYLLDPEVQTPIPTPPPPAPTPIPLPPSIGKVIVLRGVNFDFNRSDIRPDSRPVLDEAAQSLRDNPDLRVSVDGYTDSIGSDAYNEQLSVRRAEGVFRYLVNHGVQPERLEVVGYGKTHPVASNDTESGRAENRRVELRVVGQPHPDHTE